MDSSKINYQCLFDQAADGILIINPETALIENVNVQMLSLVGFSREAFIGKKLWETEAFKNSAVDEIGFYGVIHDKYRRIDDLAIKTLDGRTLSVELIGKLCDCDGEWVIQANVRDNSKRNLELLSLKVAERQLKILTESNIALSSQTTEESLLKHFCRVAVEAGGYRMAWIGVAKDVEGKPVKPISHYGIEEGYLDLVGITWADTEQRGKGPTGTAIRTGQVQFFEDFENAIRS